MFKKNHHVRIATILQSLNAEFLREKECYFAGGTAIVLSHEEYRESLDIDFMVSHLNGYRELRQVLKSSSDLSPIVRKDMSLKLAREVRADQYGIRTMLDQGGEEIKFEIVFEGRIRFETPNPDDKICGISTLTQKDMATSKLLANSDRWSDDSVFSRDLIDLAMMNLSSKVYKQALEKACTAYGDSVMKDLNKAIEGLKNRPRRLEVCMAALKMESLPEALVWEKIRRLKKI